jgi:hypothetical protein
MPKRDEHESADEKARREAADALQSQIDDIVAGHVPKARPGNLRDLVHERMIEQDEKPREEE